MQYTRIILLSFLVYFVAQCMSAMLPPNAQAAKKQLQSDEVNYLELAARLMADGNYERASIALRSLNLDDPELDRPRYHTVAGLVALRTERFEKAIAELQKALDAHTKREAESPASDEQTAKDRMEARKRVNLYLGQAYMRTSEFEKAVAMFDKAGEIGNAIPMIHALRAQAYWELRRQAEAFAALERGENRFPDDYRFLRRKVFYLIDLGFYQRAAELGKEYLAVAPASPSDFVAIGSALRQSRQLAEALSILERAHLAYPTDRDISVELTHTYLDRDNATAAADLLSNAAIHHPDLLVEAAELQRRAGRLHRSLLLNSAVTDQAKKYRQRLSIFVTMERWELAAAMGDALQRNNLLSDDDIRYAYAYALFKAGRYENADNVLGGISNGELFRKATALRKTMESCRNESWRCL